MRPRVPMIWGGEFHYWRTPPDAWDQAFASIKQLGFSSVSTYVPWDFHELAPGRYDFAGRTSPARNLLGWLALAKAHKLDVILRPGPYIYAEWNHKGPPARVAKFPRLSPRFLRESKRWIEAVGRAVAKHLASHGGPIVAVQVCNEVTGAFEFDGYADPKLHAIDAIYRRWAKEKKSQMSTRMPRIPAHWGGNHLDVPKSERGQAQSFLEFHDWYTVEYIKIMAKIFRQAGFDVPLCANLVIWFWPQHWSTLQEHVDFIAMDTYYPRGLPGNLPAAFTRVYRQFARVSKNPIAIEFGCGVWDTMHERLGFVDERHLEFTTLLALSQGVTGISYYMLVNRDNWFLSPINEWGKIRDRFIPSILRLGKIFKTIGPQTLRPLHSVGLVWSRNDHLDFVVSGGMYDHNYFAISWFEKNRYQADYKAFWDVYETLLDLGYDVDVIEAGSDNRLSSPRVLIFPMTPQWDGSCEDFARLHLKRGGHLVLVGDKAGTMALKMPPSIGTPVQKWVRDVPWEKLNSLGRVLVQLGEEPVRLVKGKRLMQFLRADARGRQILFVFSLAEETQQVEVLSRSLREIATGKSFGPLQKLELQAKSGRVFYVAKK